MDTHDREIDTPQMCCTLNIHNGYEQYRQSTCLCIQHLPMGLHPYRGCYSFRYVRKILQSILHQYCREAIREENKILTTTSLGPQNRIDALNR